MGVIVKAIPIPGGLTPDEAAENLENNFSNQAVPFGRLVQVMPAGFDGYLLAFFEDEDPAIG